MSFRSVVGLLGGVSCLLFATLSHADCTKDTDCKGDRICEAGVCQSPPPSAVAAPAVPPRADAAPAPLPEAPPGPAPVAAPPAAPRVIRVDDAPIRDDQGYSVTESDERRNKRNWKRHSTGMMVGGIVMTSLSSIAFLVALTGALANASCDDFGYDASSPMVARTYYRDCNYDGLVYGGLVTGIVLAGVGIPLIVVGGKREPRTVVGVAPWATPSAAGLTLRLSL